MPMKRTAWSRVCSPHTSSQSGLPTTARLVEGLSQEFMQNTTGMRGPAAASMTSLTKTPSSTVGCRITSGFRRSTKAGRARLGRSARRRRAFAWKMGSMPGKPATVSRPAAFQPSVFQRKRRIAASCAPGRSLS